MNTTRPNLTDDRQGPQARHRIEDPTVKSVLPSNLLAALGNTHVNIGFVNTNLANLLDTIGWPEGDSREKYLDEHQPILTTALDYARHTMQEVWVALGLIDSLAQALGQFVRDEHGELISMGADVSHDVPPGSGNGRFLDA